MAKGVEDTAFYRWPRLARAERGRRRSGPARRRARRSSTRSRRGWPGDWPATMTTLSTHDTKRQEDVRARLAVLAEIARAVGRRGRPAGTTGRARWRRRPRARSGHRVPAVADPGRRLADRRRPADRATCSRRCARPRRAPPGPQPDAGLRGRRCSAWPRPCSTTPSSPARSRRSSPRSRRDALANSLGAKLVQLTMPGVPDVYQGCELAGLLPWSTRTTGGRWTSPGGGRCSPRDGRRPDARRRAAWTPSKLLVTSRALRLRRDHPDWFAAGYAPLAAAARRPACGRLPARRARGHRRHPAAGRPAPARRLAGTALPAAAGPLAGRADRCAYTGGAAPRCCRRCATPAPVRCSVVRCSMPGGAR